MICDCGQETNAIKQFLLEVPIAYSSRGMQIAVLFSDGFSHVMQHSSLSSKGFMGSWAGDKRIRGGHRGTKRLTSNSSVLQPHFTDCTAPLTKTAFLCGTNSNICLQSRCSFVILKLINRNFNFPALIPMQTKDFMHSAFLGSSPAKSNVEIMLWAVLNYNNLFLFMMTWPSVTQLFSVRQERTGSLLIICHTEGRESSCLLFSTLPLHQFLSPVNALVAVGLKWGTEEHGAVPVFSSKIWL